VAAIAITFGDVNQFRQELRSAGALVPEYARLNQLVNQVIPATRPKEER
jgi:hypothetical protein